MALSDKLDALAILNRVRLYLSGYGPQQGNAAWNWMHAYCLKFGHEELGMRNDQQILGYGIRNIGKSIQFGASDGD